jgi:hypothetical protein
MMNTQAAIDTLRPDDAPAVEPSPGIGHNAAPISDAFPAIKARADQLATTANEWLANVEAITDQETAEACDSFLSQIKAEIDAAEAERKAGNAPHNQAIKANNERFRPVTALLETCQRLLKPLKADWLQRERDRIAVEKAAAEAAALRAIEEADAARRAAVAAAQPTVEAAVAADRAAQTAEQKIADYQAAAAAKPAVKGGLAARSSGLREYWSAVITDWPAATRHYQNRAEVKIVVQQLANADARAMKGALNIPGIDAKMEERV